MDDFSAVWNNGKFSAKLLVSSVRVIFTVGFLSLFKKVLLEQLLKVLLMPWGPRRGEVKLALEARRVLFSISERNFPEKHLTHL